MKKIISIILTSVLFLSIICSNLTVYGTEKSINSVSTITTNTNCSHTYKHIKTINPTCTSKGTKEYRCTNCNAIKKTTIAAKGHNTKLINAKKATYVKKGKKADTYCKRCKKTIKKGKSIKKLTLKTPKFSVSSGTQKFTIKYKAVKDADGFQVKYIRKGKTTTKYCKTQKSINKSFTNLSAGKYKVSLRSFITQNGKKAYSKWTNTKTITVKKKTSTISSNNNTTSQSNSHGTAYWISDSEVYHSTSNCRTLKRSSGIMSGSAPSGRRPCKVCH